MMDAAKVGRTVGRAIARDVLAEGMPREWTGLDEQDGDRLVAAGIDPDSSEWDVAVTAARLSYLATIDPRERQGDGTIAT